MNIKLAILKAGIGIIRCIYAPMKLQKTKDRITIISRQSNKPSIDIKLLDRYFKENHPKTQCEVLCRKFEGQSKVAYAFHMLKQMKCMASSRVVVLDGYCIAASILNHKDETKIVQIWHALSAIKKFGYQVIDKPEGRSREIANVMMMHRNYDYVIAPSIKTGKIFCEAFGTSMDKLRLIGLPRIDEIIGRNIEEGNALREKYKLNNGKKTILYVPTFRKGRSVKLEELVRAIDKDKYNLVIKLHPLDENYDNIPDTGLNIIKKSEENSIKWLGACDIIITDYSSLGIEASLVGKPLYYYVYDVDEYDSAVGLNINPIIDMPNVSARSGRELAEIIEKEYDFKRLEDFSKKYVSVDINNCTRQLGEFIYGINYEKPTDACS